MSRRTAGAAVVGTRVAVERSLAGLPVGSAVLVAVSGGPDSLALAAATAWVCPRRGFVPRAVVVDHGLQPASSSVADAAAALCATLGVPADVVRVHVGSVGGPEAAARTARYDALERSAVEHAAAAVLLGHTRDDQAETVLLRLARGSGARSLAAMSPVNGLWRRPFLDVPREQVRRAASEVLEPLGVSAWADPHNADPAFARVRVREALAHLVTALGPGVVHGLSRSADLLRDDADALDALAGEAFATHATVSGRRVEVPCETLAVLPDAIRSRVIRLAGQHAGVPAESFGHAHVGSVEALVVDWHGQGAHSLPGGVVAERAYGRLCLHPADDNRAGVHPADEP